MYGYLQIYVCVQGFGYNFAPIISINISMRIKLRLFMVGDEFRGLCDLINVAYFVKVIRFTKESAYELC